MKRPACDADGCHQNKKPRTGPLTIKDKKVKKDAEKNKEADQEDDDDDDDAAPKPKTPQQVALG